MWDKYVISYRVSDMANSEQQEQVDRFVLV